MAKSMVEKYEQILAQDPASTAFVELAKALIEQGDHPRAIEVCQTGLGHHKDSVVGRVLWGKALINLGKPAEAMAQFDQAIAIDRENPYAYNLIGEVLLHKGLYRSALPLLKKAVALQPNDNRVRQWLEQTQRALAGGPAPVLRDETQPNPPEGGLTDPGIGGDPQADKTDVEIRAYAPPPENAAAGNGADPFAQIPAREESGETVRGLTSTFDALAQAPAAEAPPPEPKSEPTIIPSPDLMQTQVADGGGLLGDIPPPPTTSETVIPPKPAPSRAEAPPAPPRPPPVRSSGLKPLLDEIPDLPEPSSSLEVPKVELSSTTTQAIAQEYERELRAKLAAAAAKKTFLQKHGGKLAIGTVATVAAMVALFAWLFTRAKHHDTDLPQALARAKVGINQDTPKSYRAALDLLKLAADMDDRSPDVWALTGYAHSLLYAEHGGSNDDKAKAQAAFERSRVEEKFPALVLTGNYYLADARSRDFARKQVLASNLDAAEVHELAGRILLAQKDTKGALDRFDRALRQSPADVRALVALGNYYRDSGDYAKALDVYQRALTVSPQHPEAVVGGAEARLELGVDLDDALKSVEAAPPSEDLAPDLVARRELIYARLLSAVGRHDEAVKRISDAARNFRGRGFEFQLALAEAARGVGQMGISEAAAEAALKLRPHSEDAKEALGRALIARDREKELLSRLPSEPDSRKVSLVRGIAYARLQDWRHARSELGHTQLNGKYPSEAVIYLALADAGEGQPDRAEQVLEKTLAAAKKAKGDVRVALGKVYWQRGALDKAKAQFEEASKEPSDYEGGCSLGRLLMQLGFPDVAVKPLQTSVAHNASHGEARNALIHALVAVGRPADAVKQADAWIQDNPQSAAAYRDEALALYWSGKFKDADQAAIRAIRLDGSDAEAFRVRAPILFSLGDPKAAFKALEHANRINSKDPETFCEIGRAFIRQANGDMAEKAFGAAKRENPDSLCGTVGIRAAALPSGSRSALKDLLDALKNANTVQDKVFAESTLARVQLALGSVKDARKSAEDAVSIAPLSGDAHYALGLVAVRQKDETKAKEELVQAAALEPAHAGVQLALGDLLARGDDPAAAVQAYEAFLKVGGNSSEEARVRRVLSNLKKKVAAR